MPREAGFTLVTTDQITQGDALGELVSRNDGRLRLHKLFDGTTDRSRMGKVRKLWREHMDFEDDAQLDVRRTPLGSALDVRGGAEHGSSIAGWVSFSAWRCCGALQAALLPSFGHSSAIEPGASLEIIDQVGHADADGGARDADRADDEVHTVLLTGEDMLDRRPHHRTFRVGLGRAYRHRSVLWLLTVEWLVSRRRLRKASFFFYR